MYRAVSRLCASFLLSLSLSSVALANELDEEVAAFAVSNALHTLLHEAGHMLVSELALPVIGQEEDAVDAFATVTLFEWQDEPEVDAVLDAAIGWFLMHDAYADLEDESTYFGSHDLDIQRASRTICFIYAQDPKAYKDVADDFGLPDADRDLCEADYDLSLDSWQALLDPHVLEEGEPKSDITVRYGSLKSQWAKEVQAAELLEEVADYLADSYRLPAQIEMTFESCGESNADWDTDNRQILLCTEFVDELAELYKESL